MKTVAMTSFAFAAIVLSACAHTSSHPRAPSETVAASATAPTNDADALRKALNPFDTGPTSVSQAYPTVVDGNRSLASFLDPKRTVKVDPDAVMLVAEDRDAGTRTAAFRLVKPASHSLTANLRGPNGEDLGPMTIVSHGSNDDVLDYIRKNGLRPATARELLDFVEQHGELISDYGQLVALGTVWRDKKNGEEYVTSVYRGDDGLHAVRQNVAFGPSSRTLFLATPK